MDPDIVDNHENCVICKKGGGNDVTEKLATTLTSQLQKFYKEGLLVSIQDIDLIDRLLVHEDLPRILQGGYQIHKSCYDRFNTDKLNRHLNYKRKREESAESDVQPVSVTRSSMKHRKVVLGELVCFYCEKPAVMDTKKPNKKTNQPLHAAAGRKKSSGYAVEFTERLFEMASCLEDSHVLCKLETASDVRSGELFYHHHCHRDYVHRFEAAKTAATSTQEEDNKYRKYAEYVSISGVGQYVEGSNRSTFTVVELEKVYLNKLDELGQAKSSHSTRFVDLCSRYDVGICIVQADKDDTFKAVKKDKISADLTDGCWVKLLGKVLKPVRQEILSHMKDQNRSPLSDLQTETLILEGCPKLKILASLICTGSPTYQSLPQSLEGVCQTILFNTKEDSHHHHASDKASGSTAITRHRKECLQPITFYLTVKLYTTIRSRSVLDAFFQQGLTMSYTQLCKTICGIAQRVEDLCARSGDRMIPAELRTGIFTVFIDDNVDSNSSSVTAKRHFHGTGVAILQFPTEANQGTERCLEPSSRSSQQPPSECPALVQFTNIDSETQPPSTYTCPIQFVNIIDLEEELDAYFTLQLKEEDKCLDYLVEHTIPNDADDRGASWTSYHSSMNRDSTECCTINCLLPLINHVSHDEALQLHLMNTALDYTQYLNPEQVAVGASDQPLYALKRILQWKLPLTFSDTYFPFIGGLHVEKAVLSCIGQLIRGTGLEAILVEAKLDIIGLSIALCDVNNIKKARYAVQIVAVCLQKLKLKALEERQQEEAELSTKEWLDENKDNVMFQYWTNVLATIETLLMFVRSFREANLRLMMCSLEKLIPLFFSLDHYNYARWTAVFIQDLKVLQQKDGGLFEQLLSGNFAVDTLGQRFSKIAYDHAMEQNVRKVKDSGGYTDLLNSDDTTFMRMLELAFPELHRYLRKIEGEKKADSHKETTTLFTSMFAKDCRKVMSKIVTNPFSQNVFTRLNSNYIFPDVISNDAAKLFDIGKRQYIDFKRRRFVEGKDEIFTAISKNSLSLPLDYKKVSKLAPKVKLPNSTLTKLRDGCRNREKVARSLFGSEFTGLPESLTKDGVMYQNCKSKILPDITQVVKPKSTAALVIDLSVEIRAVASFVKNSVTYKEFIISVLRRVAALGKKCDATRLDIVADHYHPNSIKSTTRLKRGSVGSQQTSFKLDDPFPDGKMEIDRFLSNDDNKSKLNSLFAEVAIGGIDHWGWDKEFFITYGDTVKGRDSQEISIYSNMEVLEEADNRMISHIDHILQSGHDSVTVRTVDSDVIVILLGFFNQFLQINPAVDVLVDFGTGAKNRKCYSVTDAFTLLGKERALGMMFFHAFTGCDSVSSFYKHSKKSWYSHWSNSKDKAEISEAFRVLGVRPSQAEVNKYMPLLENFVASAYSKNAEGASLASVRYDLFWQRASNDLKELPPTRDSLLLHVKRSSYQAGWIWGNSLSELEPPRVDNWGWEVVDGQLLVKWTTSDRRSELNTILKTCSCRTAKCTTCSCASAGLKCISFCKCVGKCENPN